MTFFSSSLHCCPHCLDSYSWAEHPLFINLQWRQRPFYEISQLMWQPSRRIQVQLFTYGTYISIPCCTKPVERDVWKLLSIPSKTKHQSRRPAFDSLRGSAVAFLLFCVAYFVPSEQGVSSNGDEPTVVISNTSTPTITSGNAWISVRLAKETALLRHVQNAHVRTYAYGECFSLQKQFLLYLSKHSNASPCMLPCFVTAQCHGQCTSQCRGCQMLP